MHSMANASVDKQIIVFEIAKETNGSVKGWTQETWWRSDWKAHGKAGVADRIYKKYKTNNYKVTIIKSGNHYIVYTKKAKNGKISFHVSSTKNPEQFARDSKRINEYTTRYTGKYEVHVSGVNEVEIREPPISDSHAFELSPAIAPIWPDNIDETIPCEKGSGVSHYSVKELKKGFVEFRGNTTNKTNKKGSTVVLNASEWLQSGLTDKGLEKKWRDEVEKAVNNICGVSKTKLSSSRKSVNFLDRKLKRYLDNLLRIKKEECKQGIRPPSECVFKQSKPTSLEIRG